MFLKYGALTVHVQTRFVEQAKLLNSKSASAARHVQEHMVCCNSLSTASQRLTSQPGLRPSQPDLRLSQPDLRPNQPSFRLDGQVGGTEKRMYGRTCKPRKCIFKIKVRQGKGIANLVMPFGYLFQLKCFFSHEFSTKISQPVNNLKFPC